MQYVAKENYSENISQINEKLGEDMLREGFGIFSELPEEHIQIFAKHI